MGSEIPVWVGGMQKWVTGVTKRTSCEDIVKAVLTFTDRTREAKVERDLRRYTLVERWRKVEKPLDSKSRILKVWKTWGDEQCNVRFLLKKTSSSQKDVRTSRKQKRQHASRTGRGHRGVEEASDGSSSSSTTAEDLKRLISLQEMTLVSQNKQLRLKDDEIEHFETRMHLTRMRDIGENYVQDTYLSEVTDSDSGSSSASTVDLQSPSEKQASELYQKVQDLCQRIQQEEGHIKELTCRIRKSVSLRDKNAQCEKEQKNIARTEIQELASVNERQRLTIEQNDKTLTDCDRIADEKATYIKQLETDYVEAENESVRLQGELETLQQELLETECSTCELSEGGFDSNSDTGISSMHSSGEESGYVLDTLV